MSCVSRACFSQQVIVLAKLPTRQESSSGYWDIRIKKWLRSLRSRRPGHGTRVVQLVQSVLGNPC